MSKKGKRKGKEKRRDVGKRDVARRCKLTRETRETVVELELDIDGSGEFDVDLPDAFLRHMVETLARYAGFDLSIEGTGDIDHHLIEDVAITLGKAVLNARKEVPVKRLGSAIVPMDDALVGVHVDIVDRPFVHIELPQDDMYEHFLRSFALEARITLHTQVIRGRDAHHIIEATFKGLGVALKEALVPLERLVSTKDGVELSDER